MHAHCALGGPAGVPLAPRLGTSSACGAWWGGDGG